MLSDITARPPHSPVHVRVITAPRLLLLFLWSLSPSLAIASPPTSKPASQHTKRAPLPVWIDTDPAVGVLGKDVDDGFALIQAFRSKELAIRGVSVVFGNAPLKKAYPIAQELMKLLHAQHLPVAPGARSHRDLGKSTAASKALAAALRKEKLTLLVLGPATNVATVLLRHPRLAKQIVQIISVAGRRPGQRFLTGVAKRPHRDFNFECDPEAYRVLLRSKIPLVFAPWEISSKLWLRAPDLKKIAASGPVGAWIARPAQLWLGFWMMMFRVQGFNPFDTLAVGYLTSPQLLLCQDMPMKIVSAPNDTPNKPFLGKRSHTKLYLHVLPQAKQGRLVTYCHTPKPTFHKDLLRRLTAHPSHKTP